MTNHLAILLPFSAFASPKPVNGVTWTHTVSGGGALVGDISHGNRKTIDLLRESDV